MIHDTSLEEGQRSKEKHLLDDEMNVDLHDGLDKDTESRTNNGKKDKDKWCFRCCTKGHVKEVCKANLFCNICQSDEHMAAKCPMKRKP